MSAAKHVAAGVTIAFPVTCTYRGGIKELGAHGRHLRIDDGRIGHGELSLSHGIPLTEVAAIEITERATEGTPARSMVAEGVHGGGRTPAAKAKQFTDIAVRTDDGQVGLWIVEQRGGAWVRSKLAPALEGSGFSL